MLRLRCFCFYAYRYTVGKYVPVVRELRPGDFDPKEKFWTRLPLEGSKFGPQHQSVDFRWKDYCPMVFRYKQFPSVFQYILML
jgi:hypothetical protein